jgi:manganese/iron transport system ATP-binding protein
MNAPASPETDELLRCEKLVVGWNGRPLLPPIDAVVRRGRFVAVVGRNGSGKSTWFKTLIGEVAAVDGRIVRAPELERLVYVPQGADVDPILPVTAGEVVLQGRLRGWRFLLPMASRADRDAARQAMVDADVAALARRPFRDLSRGQRQRVLFARMLASEAQLGLLDEPTAAMDVAAEREAVDRLTGLARDHGVTVIIVSHTPRVAERHADDVLLFDRVAGEVVFGERDAVLEHPAYQRYLRGEGVDA